MRGSRFGLKPLVASGAYNRKQLNADRVFVLWVQKISVMDEHRYG